MLEKPRMLERVISSDVSENPALAEVVRRRAQEANNLELRMGPGAMVSIEQPGLRQGAS